MYDIETIFCVSCIFYNLVSVNINFKLAFKPIDYLRSIYTGFCRSCTNYSMVTILNINSVVFQNFLPVPMKIAL